MIDMQNRRDILAIAGGGLFLLSGCVTSPPTRIGMVKNPDTGLMIGSRVSASLLTDASFYKNPTMKIRTRNTSGDMAFDMTQFQGQLNNAFEGRGYISTQDNNFGLLLDLNVMYSGHIQSNMETQFAILGGLAGGLGVAQNDGTGIEQGIGTVSGAALGSIIGSFITDDTYIIVSRASFAVTKFNSRSSKKTITLGGNKVNKDARFEDETENENVNGLKQTTAIDVAVFAGGRNTRQSTIAPMVRDRLVRIVSNLV